jgi:hypothetical protein
MSDWNRIIDFDAFVWQGLFSGEDLASVQFADDPPTVLCL